MRLAHLHLPNITQFTRVSNLQQTLTNRLLAYKKAQSLTATETATSRIQTLDPTIITFTPNPVYTTGRRDLPPAQTSTSEQAASPRVIADLSLPPSLEPIRSILTLPKEKTIATKYDSTKTENPSNQIERTAEYHPTLRGGQTTYHGPGQLVAYTILDLRRLGLSPRCHIRLLENSVIDVLRGYSLRGLLTEDPGVWVDTAFPYATPTADQAGSAQQDRTILQDVKKITAVGVHLRRHISSFGIGLNVTDEPLWFFRQIVACGLEGKEAVSLEGLGVKDGVTVDQVGERFVQSFVRLLNRDFVSRGKGEGIDEIYKISMEDVLG